MRRLFEPVATGLAAKRVDDAALERLAEFVQGMEQAGDDMEQLIHCDHAFHATVFAATGNRTLMSILDGLSSRTLRARIWRGVVEAEASQQTIREHRAIHQALAAHDRPLAEAAALMHVYTSERWLRDVLAQRQEAGA